MQVKNKSAQNPTVISLHRISHEEQMKTPSHDSPGAYVKQVFLFEADRNTKKSGDPYLPDGNPKGTLD